MATGGGSPVRPDPQRRPDPGDQPPPELTGSGNGPVDAGDVTPTASRRAGDSGSTVLTYSLTGVDEEEGLPEPPVEEEEVDWSAVTGPTYHEMAGPAEESPLRHGMDPADFEQAELEIALLNANLEANMVGPAIMDTRGFLPAAGAPPQLRRWG